MEPTMKRTFPLLACVLILASLAACSPKASSSKASSAPASSAPSSSAATSSAPAAPFAYNPLSGLDDLGGKTATRPIAVMINNISVAQPVQKGTSGAEILMETLVEGGITRMMAIYENPYSLANIGSARSARVPFGELAYSLDAVYVHSGQDPHYMMDFFNAHSDFTNADLGTNFSSAAFRVSNGLPTEDTEFTSGAKLQAAITKANIDMSYKDGKVIPAFSFNPPTSPVVPSGAAAGTVFIPFSSSYSAGATYDAAAKVYDKLDCKKPQIDSDTGKQLTFTNIVVLFADNHPYPDGVHIQVNYQTGGSVYYFSMGHMTTFTWTKPSESAPLSLKASDGSTLNVNPGKTYLAVVTSDNKSQVTYS